MNLKKRHKLVAHSVPELTGIGTPRLSLKLGRENRTGPGVFGVAICWRQPTLQFSSLCAACFISDYLPSSLEHLLPLIRARIWRTGNIIAGVKSFPYYTRCPETSVGIRLKAVCAEGRTHGHTYISDAVQHPAGRAPSVPHSILFWLWCFLCHFPLPGSLLRFFNSGWKHLEKVKQRSANSCYQQVP